MTENHPITPPPEPMIPDHYRGNDICVYREGFHAGYKYAAARRPKPPSLKEQALQSLGHLDKGAESQMDTTEAVDTIRRALEALDD